MTKVRKKIGTIPINDIEQQVQQSTSTAITQMQQDVSDFIDEETAQYPEIGGAFKFQEDPEGRSEITTDSEGKIISYRKADGTKVENVRIETNRIHFISEEGKQEFANALKDLPIPIKRYDLPDIGTVNLVSETFYLTANAGYSDKTGIWPVQIYENTLENAQQLRVCVVYYVKSSLRKIDDTHYERYNDGVSGHDIALDFYAATKVTKVNNKYYVTSTLVDGQVVPESIKVTQIVDTPDVLAWPTDKKTEHYCIVDIDFGNYLNGRFYVGVKFQGNSTLYVPKRNFRFTFYKNNKYEKKLKIKIGEMPRLSGFNLKAFYFDSTRLKEYVLNRLFMAIWENRPTAELSYPWCKKEGYYTGATGMIKGFPIKVSIGGEFFGVDIFGLKKDEKNYMLDGDDDASGIFVCGEAGEHAFDARGWADEMGVKGRPLAYPDWEDSVSAETATAINNFFDFVVGHYKDANENTYIQAEVKKIDSTYYVTSTLTKNEDGTYSVNENSIAVEHVANFNRKDAETHMAVIDFIDYLICIEAFFMPDNTIHNMVLYTGSDKEKFYSFFYDLDGSFAGTNSTVDTLSYWNPEDNIEVDPLWGSIYNAYKDDIVLRYRYLRNSNLSVEYVANIIKYAYKVIPQEWFEEEQRKWGNMNSNFDSLLSYLDFRLKWMDDSLFNIKN